MTYTKVGPFTNDSASPPIDKSFLDALETFLHDRVVDGNDASTNFVPVWNGTAWTYQKLTTSQLDAAAGITSAQLAGSIALSKLTDPTTGKVVGSSGGVAAAVFPPGHQYAYVEQTSAVAITGTELAPTDVVSAGAISFDGSTTVEIDVYTHGLLFAGTASVGDDLAINLWDGATDLGRLARVKCLVSGGTVQNWFPTGKMSRVLTPTNASHTYKVRGWTTGTGSNSVRGGAGGAGAELPIFIRIRQV